MQLFNTRWLNEVNQNWKQWAPPHFRCKKKSCFMNKQTEQNWTGNENIFRQLLWWYAQADGLYQKSSLLLLSFLFLSASPKIFSLFWQTCWLDLCYKALKIIHYNFSLKHGSQDAAVNKTKRRLKTFRPTEAQRLPPASHDSRRLPWRSFKDKFRKTFITIIWCESPVTGSRTPRLWRAGQVRCQKFKTCCGLCISGDESACALLSSDTLVHHMLLCKQMAVMILVFKKQKVQIVCSYVHPKTGIMTQITWILLKVTHFLWT